MTNLNTAFDVAEKYLDIPKMLDAEGEEKDADEERQIPSGHDLLHSHVVPSQTNSLTVVFAAISQVCEGVETAFLTFLLFCFMCSRQVPR